MTKAYCARCARPFRTELALKQHHNDSDRHNRCEKCGFDGETWERLLQHHRKLKHRIICQGCDDGNGMLWVPGSQAYLDHLKASNVCKTCEEHFQTPGNLESHQLVHLTRSIECYGCDEKYPTYSAMILHLESGACESGITIIDLNESAAMCYQWKGYLDEDYRDNLLECRDLQFEYSEPVHPFNCPTCEAQFVKLSAMFQHVDSKACQQTLSSGKIGKLVKYLESQHEADGSE